MTRFVLFALAFSAAPLAAQTPNADADPRQGTLAVGSSEVALDLEISALEPQLDPDCPGMIDPSAPDVALTRRSAGPMRIWVRSASDATLTVVTPSGEVLCVDDEDWVQPALLMEQAPAGRYAVWVGTFSSFDDTNTAATLYAGPPPPAPRPQTSASAPSVNAQNNDLAVVAGGSHSANMLDLPDYCVGFFNAEPSARVSGETPYTVTAESEVDLTLAVRTRGGGWLCNDDAMGRDPAVQIQGEGEHTVWVGTFRGYARGDAPEATLRVTDEMIADVVTPVGPVEPREVFSTGTYAPLDLDARGEEITLAASQESLDVRVMAMGETGNPVSGDHCRGSLPVRATATLSAEGAGPLTLVASGDSDLVLVARGPDDTWYCSDDAMGTDPAIEIEDPAGEIQIWVGAYSLGNSVQATLTFTRGPLAEMLPDELYDLSTEFVDAPYAEGTYSGDELGGDAEVSLSLAGGMAETRVMAGGDLAMPVVGDGCVGFITANPTASLQTGAEIVSFVASAGFEGDLTMLVRTPDGRLFCSDDYEGTDPGIEVSGAGDGTYSIWVGTYAEMDSPIQSTLTVREDVLPDPY